MEDLKKQSAASELAGMQEAPNAENDELSQQEQEQISGGWGDIQGSSTADKHKDWSEVTGFSAPLTNARSLARVQRTSRPCWTHSSAAHIPIETPLPTPLRSSELLVGPGAFKADRWAYNTQARPA